MIHCCFCARPRTAVGWLFRSSLGGVPAAICDGCVRQFGAALAIDELPPEDAATLAVEVRRLVGADRVSP